MNINKILVAALASAALIFTACSKNEAEGIAPATSLSINVHDSGYVSTETRTEEQGFATRFVTGDRIGIYAVKDGAVVVENALFKAEAANGKVAWINDKVELPADAKFFAYYPYTDRLEDVNATAATAEEFFSKKIAAWDPAVEQQAQVLYTGADLMVATGELSQTVLSFKMAHQMSLMLFKLPADASSVTFEEINPYQTAEGFRLLVKPGTSLDLTGSFKVAKPELFSFTAKAADKGEYKTFNIR